MESIVSIESLISYIHGVTHLSNRQIKSVVELLQTGNSIPFIARYRKEATNDLDEIEIADIATSLKKFHEIVQRQGYIIKTIEEQGKLTANLKNLVLGTFDVHVLEDIYAPFKRKRKTKAQIAIESGLEPLAKIIAQQRFIQLEKEAAKYLNDVIRNTKSALSGARDIIAEWISDNEETRHSLRRLYDHYAVISSKLVKGKEEEASKYRDYFNVSEPLQKCPSHRMLALRRAEDEGFLKLSIAPPNEKAIQILGRQYITDGNDCSEQVKLAAEDAYSRLIAPSLENEFRKRSKEKADKEAIQVFCNNLYALLMEAPLGRKTVLGIDPGFKSGCKIVALDDKGDCIANDVIYPHPPQSKPQEAEAKIRHWIDFYQIEVISIGNGTAGKETIQWLQSLDCTKHLELYFVSESGASIYSATSIAREEFPDLDLTVRGAISIGRRLMDPLAELIKIDAKSIGVGQYQHDVDQSDLKESLDATVIRCVNQVGVRLNTASKHLLAYVSGIGPVMAQKIVAHRSQIGRFTNRKQLLEVAGLGKIAYQQCAGFLRIDDADNPLDGSGIHPESYPIIESISKSLKVNVATLMSNEELRASINWDSYVSDKVGKFTLADIAKELDKPGLDPRGHAQPYEGNSGVNDISDLHTDMVLQGTVTNITKFGAFVDIGVKQDGLVHISMMANKFIKDPMEVVHLTQKVTVKVIEVDVARKRIQLSMKDI